MRHSKSVPETRGDVLIRSLWEIQTESIIDVRFRDADMRPIRNREGVLFFLGGKK